MFRNESLIHLEDTGCHIHPKCLECPLPECVLDNPYNPRAPRNTEKDAEVMALLNQGYKPAQVAAMKGITERSVFRAQARSRAHENA